MGQAQISPPCQQANERISATKQSWCAGARTGRKQQVAVAVQPFAKAHGVGRRVGRVVHGAGLPWSHAEAGAVSADAPAGINDGFIPTTALG